MTPVDPDLVAAWIAMSKARNGTEAHDECSWAFMAVFERADDVEFIWAFVLAVLQRDQSRLVVQLLSAGPLENLIADHGDEVIDRVEQEAESNPAFAKLLGGVWKSDTSDAN